MPEQSTAQLLERIEAYLDAAPRSGAVAIEVGKFTLFRADGPWQFYARPRLGLTDEIDVDDVRVLLDRQSELKLPHTIEWVFETTPSLAGAAEAAGLTISRHPLLVLEKSVAPPALSDGYSVRITEADDPAFSRARAVANVGFGEMGTHVGKGGPAERDRHFQTVPADVREFLRQRARDGLSISAAVFDTDGPVSVGTHQPVGDVTEIVGVATLPSARRRGLGAAVTALLVEDARARGIDLIFLSATDEDVARVYERVGFTRIGYAGAAEREVSAPDDKRVDVDAVAG